MAEGNGGWHLKRSKNESLLIRGAGVHGAPRTDKTCPNCAAPLETNMAGECNYCGAKVTSGQFD